MIDLLVALALSAFAQTAPPAQEAQGAAASPLLQKFEQFLERFHPFGDFRLRYDNDARRDDEPDRNRTRIRGRLGARYDATDWGAVGARIVTHEPDSVDPNSSHVTLGRGWDGVEIQLDQAYLEARPPMIGGLVLRGGKFAHPFVFNPVFTEVIWDADVNPEGIAATYEFPLAEGLKARLAAGEYVAVEQNLSDEAALTALQALVDYEGHFVSFDYWNWHHPTADGSAVLFAQNAGNEVAAGEFVSAFEIVHGTLGLRFELFGQPAALGAEAWKNLEAENDRDFGWAAGASAGRAKEAGDVSARVLCQLVEQDSVFSPVAQDDYPFQTNFRGVLATVRVLLDPRVNVELWGMALSREHRGNTATTDEDPTTLRFRIDFNVRF